MNLEILKSNFNNVRPEVFLAVGLLFISFIIQKYRNRKKLPPGPIGLPIVGYLPFLTEWPHLKFIKLAEKYGSVFSLNMGSKLVVILNDAESIRDAFSKKELLARPPEHPLRLFKGVQSPFFDNDFKKWQEQRRFILHTMRDLGLGKSKIEGHIQDEIQYFLKFLDQSKGKAMDLTKPLTPSMSNNICSLVFGERYDYDNPVRIVMDHALENLTVLLTPTGTYMFLPWISKLLTMLKLVSYERGLKAADKIIGLTEEKISKHEETLDPKNIRDYIDGYLLEMKNRTQKDPKSTFTDETLKGSVITLFNAGSETVRTTITWCMYVMADFPEIQERVQKEIEEVLGQNKFPEFPDQKDMPYTQAVIREVMRWKTMVPLNVLRYTLEDVDVAGYCIPKGAIVIANFWAIHHDSKCWKNPEDFQPERFLNPDGTLLKTNNFMPFSIGKRSCPGEPLAVMEVFLYFVAILQRFKVCFPKGYKPDYEMEMGVTLRLKPFPICFIPK